MTTSVKLAVGGVLVAGVTAYLAYSAASSEWQYYLTVDECLAAPPALRKARIRVNGKVAAESLDIASDRTEATFLLEGSNGRLRVRCTGPLPDNLAENIDVVVEGSLKSGEVFHGDRVLTRCASKYKQGVENRAG